MANVSEKIIALQKRYLENLPERKADIESAWSAVEAEPSKENLAALHCCYHKLAGSAGMYGLQSLSDIARKSELDLDPYANEDEALNDVSILADGVAAVLTEIQSSLDAN